MKKRSFFEKFTGGIRLDDDEMEEEGEAGTHLEAREDNFLDEESEEGQLSVDVYQTPNDIVVQAMVAGVRIPEDLTIDISRDMVTIKGKREENRSIQEDDYFVRELYWGAFSRTILLPEEVDPEEAEAVEKNGLVIIKIPKINKEKRTTLKVKSL